MPLQFALKHQHLIQSAVSGDAAVPLKPKIERPLLSLKQPGSICKKSFDSVSSKLETQKMKTHTKKIKLIIQPQILFLIKYKNNIKNIAQYPTAHL